jgi:hypothetical protein
LVKKIDYTSWISWISLVILASGLRDIALVTNCPDDSGVTITIEPDDIDRITVSKGPVIIAIPPWLKDSPWKLCSIGIFGLGLEPDDWMLGMHSQFSQVP